MFLLFIILTYVFRAEAIDLTPGKEVPRADVLYKILKKHVQNFSVTQDGSIMEYLFKGKERKNSPNLDMNIKLLDVEGVKRIARMAWKKYQDDKVDGLMLSDWLPETEQQRGKIEKLEDNFRRAGDNSFGYQQLDVVANIALRQMKQSLYAAKERIASTLRLRKKYSNTLRYKIAIYISMINQIMVRMSSYYFTMEKWIQNRFHKKLPKPGVHFLWWLIFYERALSCNVDITNSARQLWQLQAEYLKMAERR